MRTIICQKKQRKVKDMLELTVKSVIDSKYCFYSNCMHLIEGDKGKCLHGVDWMCTTLNSFN